MHGEKRKTATLPRAAPSIRTKTGAVAGVYPISTGEAELVPDGYHSDGWLLLINGVQSSHVIVGQPRMLDFEYCAGLLRFSTRIFRLILIPKNCVSPIWAAGRVL